MGISGLRMGGTATNEFEAEPGRQMEICGLSQGGSRWRVTRLGSAEAQKKEWLLLTLGSDLPDEDWLAHSGVLRALPIPMATALSAARNIPANAWKGAADGRLQMDPRSTTGRINALPRIIGHLESPDKERRPIYAPHGPSPTIM